MTCEWDKSALDGVDYNHGVVFLVPNKCFNQLSDVYLSHRDSGCKHRIKCFFVKRLLIFIPFIPSTKLYLTLIIKVGSRL